MVSSFCTTILFSSSSTHFLTSTKSVISTGQNEPVNCLLSTLKFLVPHTQQHSFCKTPAFSCLFSPVQLPAHRKPFLPPAASGCCLTCCWFFYYSPHIPSLSCLSLFFCTVFISTLPCVSPLPCSSQVWHLFRTLFVSGGCATTTSSGVAGMVLAHHLLIYFLWSQHISSFCMLFLTNNQGPSTFLAKARLAVRAKHSPASSGAKALFCQSLDLQSDMHLLSPLLFHYFSPHH